MVLCVPLCMNQSVVRDTIIPTYVKQRWMDRILDNVPTVYVVVTMGLCVLLCMNQSVVRDTIIPTYVKPRWMDRILDNVPTVCVVATMVLCVLLSMSQSVVRDTIIPTFVKPRWMDITDPTVTMVCVVVVVTIGTTINVPTCVTHPSCPVIVMPIFPNGVMMLKQVAASISRTVDVVVIATILTPNMIVTTSAVSVKS